MQVKYKNTPVYNGSEQFEIIEMYSYNVGYNENSSGFTYSYSKQCMFLLNQEVLFDSLNILLTVYPYILNKPAITTDRTATVYSKPNSFCNYSCSLLNNHELLSNIPNTTSNRLDTISNRPETISFTPESISYPPESISYRPETIFFPPDRISFPSETMFYPLETISFSPETIFFRPDRTSYPPERISFSPDRTFFPPERISFSPDRTFFRPDRISYPPETIFYRPKRTRNRHFRPKRSFKCRHIRHLILTSLISYIV